MKALVTGGAGFIGSHVVDQLVDRGWRVVVYDNLSTGYVRHLDRASSTGRVELVHADILDDKTLTAAMEGASTVFHLAANADVREGKTDRHIDLELNVIGTHKVLEAMCKTGADRIVFTSSATVYGEPDRFPTPEDHPLIQTSLYGASKLSAESMIQAYAEYFSIKGYIFRFVSWVGERYSHGVVFDFVNKLRANPSELEILGDGNQRKSYLHVEDGIRGVFKALEKIPGNKVILNLGHDDFMTVTRLAEIVCQEMGLDGVSFRFTGGIRGWVGDSPFVHLDTSRIKQAGFTPGVSIEEGIRRTVRYLLSNEWLLETRSGKKNARANR